MINTAMFPRVLPALLGAVLALLPCAYGRDLVSQTQFDQRLGEPLPLHAQFRDEAGTPVPLATYFTTRPVILVLTYFACNNLCGTMLSALTTRLARIDLIAGRDFDVLVASIDPGDTPATATRKKQAYVALYGRADAARGWHFVTGEPPAIAELTQAAGFRYVRDPASGQYAHPAGVLLLTPAGRIARYFAGVDFPERELKYGLIEASSNRIGSPVDRLWLLCYHYDAATGRYGAAVGAALRASGLLTVAGLGGAIVIWLRRERAAASKRP
jgi:protein SCO1/2